MRSLHKQEIILKCVARKKITEIRKKLIPDFIFIQSLTELELSELDESRSQ